jgi:hypothetical protein
MKLTRQMLAVLVLAWAAALAQSDARPRGAKPTVNAARGGQHSASPGNRRPAAGPAITRKNAVGIATPLAGIGPPSAAPVTSPGANAAGVKANAIGARPASVSLPAPAGAAKIGLGASPAAGVRPSPPAFSAHGGAISGTGIARPGTASGVIGGPAKLAGGITGTGMKPKR